MEALNPNFRAKYRDWQTYLDAVFEKEADYRKAIVDRYNIKLSEAKEDFCSFVKKYDCRILKRKNFIEAKDDDFYLLRMDFDEPVESNYFSFQLAIRKEVRNLYSIIIKPKSNLSIPSYSVQRPKPKTQLEIENFTIKLKDEYLLLEQRISDLYKINFNFCWYRADNKSPDILGMEGYQSFKLILDFLFND